MLLQDNFRGPKAFSQSRKQAYSSWIEGGKSNKGKLMTIVCLVISELFHWDHMEEVISTSGVELAWQIWLKQSLRASAIEKSLGIRQLITHHKEEKAYAVRLFRYCLVLRLGQGLEETMFLSKGIFGSRMDLGTGENKA